MDAPAVESGSYSHTFNLPALRSERKPKSQKTNPITNHKVGWRRIWRPENWQDLKEMSQAYRL